MLFWGVREMKRLHALKVMKPQILADIAHDVKFLSDRKKHRKIRSKICPNALKNPNFPDQVLLFDVVCGDTSRCFFCTHFYPLSFALNHAKFVIKLGKISVAVKLM